MSSNYQSKNKALNKLQVVEASTVWVRTGLDSNNKPKYVLNKDLDIYGKVTKGTSSYISKTNNKGSNSKYIDDFSSLNRRTKENIVDMFENNNNRVVYLVRTDKQSKTAINPMQSPVNTLGVTKQLTASVEPNDAPNKAVDWSIAWAEGATHCNQDVENYVTVTPTSDGSLTADVTAKQAFGSDKIIITVTTRKDNSIINISFSLHTSVKGIELSQTELEF